MEPHISKGAPPNRHNLKASIEPVLDGDEMDELICIQAPETPKPSTQNRG